MSREYCAERSVNSNERMEGSADRVTAWLLFEHRGAWSAKPLDDGSLPDTTVAWLRAAAAALKTAGFAPRLQLVRQPSRDGAERAFFVQLARGGETELYGFAGTDTAMPLVDFTRLVAEP